MAELPSTNITVTHAKNALGSSSNNISSLCGASNINKWSFYRPRKIQINSTSKKVELGTAYTSSKLGDFRRYDHAAYTPYVVTTSTKTYNEGSTTFAGEIDVRTERLNIIELVNLTTPYLQTDYYASTTDRANKTNKKGYKRELLDLATETPPAGHTNNQTQSPDSGAQVITDTINVSYLSSTPNGYLYCETFICESNGNPLMYFDASGYTTITVNRNNYPKLRIDPTFSYSLYGYDAVALIQMDGAADDTDIDTDLTLAINGTVNRYYALVGWTSGGDAYRLGATSFSGRLRRVGGSTINYTLSQTSLSGGSSNASISTTNLFGTNDTFAYNDLCYLELVSASGISQGDLLTITNSPF